MVHVEVYLGGEETVGSVSGQSWRAIDQKCGVQRFPCWRQAETGTWTLIRCARVVVRERTSWEVRCLGLK